MMFFSPYTSVGQVDTTRANLARAAQVRVNDLYRQWTNLQAEAAKQQRRLNELLSVSPKSSSDAVKQASREFFDEIARLERSFPALQAEVARTESLLRTAQGELNALNAAPPPTAPRPTVSCAELDRRIQDATRMGQAPAIINALRRLYTDQRCDVSCAELASRIESATRMNQPPAVIAALRTLYANRPCDTAISSSTPGEGGVTEPNAAARPNYLVPAIVVGVALLAGGYLLTRPR